MFKISHCYFTMNSIHGWAKIIMSFLHCPYAELDASTLTIYAECNIKLGVGYSF